MADDVQSSLPPYEEWLATDYRPIRGGAPEGDAPGGDGGDQGAEGTDSGLYDLDSVDPEIRDQLQPHLKAIEANATKKFQEAAEYRKGWQPYEELGLRDMDPQGLKQLLEFAQLTQDPDQFDQWLKVAAEERGLLNGESDDLDLEDPDELSSEKVQELIEKQVAEKLSPIEQSLTQQQEAAKVEQANSEISDALEAIKADNSSLFEGKKPEEQEEVTNAIVRLAYTHSDDSSLSVEEMIQKGFEEYKGFIGQGEKALFDDKSKQPSTPEGPGAAHTSPDKITSFDDPKLQASALAKLRNG